MDTLDQDSGPGGGAQGKLVGVAVSFRIGHLPGAVFIVLLVPPKPFGVDVLAYIPYVPYEDATGPLAEHYARFAEPGGGVDNIIRVHSLNPPSMGHHVTMYAHLMRGKSPLSRIQREMIAVTVSAENDCFY